MLDVLKAVADYSDTPIVVAMLVWVLRAMERMQKYQNEILKNCLDKLE